MLPGNPCYVNKFACGAAMTRTHALQHTGSVVNFCASRMLSTRQPRALCIPAAAAQLTRIVLYHGNGCPLAAPGLPG